MKKNLILFLSLFPAVLAVGCNKREDPITGEYKEKAVNIYRRKNEVDKTMTLRFYEANPNIPYISVYDYFEEFFNTKLNKTNKDHKYVYTNKYNGSLIFDIKNNTFTSNGLSSFNNHPNFIENTGKLFIQHSHSEATLNTVKTVSLEKYNISLYEDDNAYVPLSLLSSLVGGLASYDIAYNGKDIYVLDHGGQLGVKTNPSYFGNSYFINNKEPRPEDVINYTYNELCLVFDNLRGYTRQLHMGDANLLSYGLDGVLSRYYPKTKEYLLSPIKDNYYEGIYALFNALNDGGHTGIISAPSELTQVISKQSEEEFKNLIDDCSELSSEKVKVQVSFAGAKTKCIPTSGSNYYYYEEDCKTAYIGFDKFNVDYEGWDNYYIGLDEEPVYTDTYAFVRSKMIQAKEDGAKNLVLDLTTNGGGSSYALEGILGLFNGAVGYIRTRDTFNDYIVREYHDIDANLDGKFDEADKQFADSFNFNVGVLTSNYAFSCGNLLPFNMQEIGYKIIGEKTGGGSCAVAHDSTIDGIVYVHSSYLCLVDENGQNIDGGVDADFVIEKPQISTYLYDCSKFFDLSYVGNYLNTAYQQ